VKCCAILAEKSESEDTLGRSKSDAVTRRKSDPASGVGRKSDGRRRSDSRIKGKLERDSVTRKSSTLYIHCLQELCVY